MATPAKTGRVEAHPVTGFETHHGGAMGYDDLQGPVSSAKVPPAQAPTWRQYDFGLGVDFWVSGAADIGAQGGNEIMTLSVGDRAWFSAESDLAQTLTFLIRNVSIH